jgi:ubiquinol-cytochrome c reductase iron-sulfur subunit
LVGAQDVNPFRWILVALVVSVLASIGLLVIYFLSDQPQVEGVLLGLALGGIGVSLVIWSVGLVKAPIGSEPIHRRASADADVAATEEVLAPEEVTRRAFLVRLMIGAGTALAAALAVPVLSLGPSPGRALFRTDWSPGARVVDESGQPVRIEDLAFESVRTVFPENFVGSADAQTLLLRVRPSDLQLPDGRGDWAPDGCVAYSKVCTHAGCPVGLYRAQDHALLCPCHQSTFDVLRGAVPTFGPAARPLPQLPLDVDADGFLIARAGFSEPVGPSFWNMTHDEDTEA